MTVASDVSGGGAVPNPLCWHLSLDSSAGLYKKAPRHTAWRGPPSSGLCGLVSRVAHRALSPPQPWGISFFIMFVIVPFRLETLAELPTHGDRVALCTMLRTVTSEGISLRGPGAPLGCVRNDEITKGCVSQNLSPGISNTHIVNPVSKGQGQRSSAKGTQTSDELNF